MKKTTKIILTSILSLLFTNCVTYPKILSENERSLTYKIESNLDKKSIYKKLILWTSKNFVNSNETIKTKDLDLGILIAKGNIDCNALKLGSGYAANQIIRFTLDIQFDDKKIDVNVLNVIASSSGAYDDNLRPSNHDELLLVKTECVDSFVNDLKNQF
jgi:hypothetical protein